MKIAFLHHSFILGSGIDSLIYQWAERLGRKHEVHVYCLRTDYWPAGSPYPETCVIGKGDSTILLHVTSDSISRTKTGSAVFAGMSGEWKVGRVAKEIEQMDVVVTQLYPATVMLPKLKHPKWVHIEWSIPSMNLWDNMQGRIYSRLLHWGNGVGCRKADLVLSPSRFVYDWVKKGYGVESQVMFLDGIDFELFDKSKYENRYDTNNILYVGRIAPHKNLEVLIRAFAVVQEAVPNAQLVLAGSLSFKNYYAKLLALIKELKLYNVHFLGTVPWAKLPEYYAFCTLWCSPTKWEGFLKSEAYAFAKPMVAFDYTSNNETVLNTKTGLLVPTAHTTGFDLAWGLKYLLHQKQKARELGENGYKWARENLDTDKIVENLEKVFSDLIQ